VHTQNGIRSAWGKMNCIRKALSIAGAIGFVLSLGPLFPSPAQAYTVVTVSTKAAPGLESAFIAETTTQYEASLFINPLFAGTYQVQLIGLNPNYNPPITNVQLLSSLPSAATTNYVPGFADGMTYQQQVIEGLVGTLGNLCSSPTDYMLIQTGIGTFNTPTCQDVTTTIINQLFQLSLSTPTPIPPEP